MIHVEGLIAMMQSVSLRDVCYTVCDVANIMQQWEMQQIHLEISYGI